MSRRGFIAASAGGAAAASASPTSAKAASLRVTGLAVDGVDRPLGLGNAEPLLSWRIESIARGVMQGAYRISCASSLDALKAGRADIWDSGKVASDQSFTIPYGGPALDSRERVYWRVQVWDKGGKASRPSQPSWWEMGLLKPEDWRASWLAVTDAATLADHAAGLSWVWGDTPSDPTPRKFRFRFDLDEAPVEARLTVIAQSVLKGLWIDGVSLTPDPPGDASTSQAVDVVLKPGANILAFEVGVKPKTAFGLPSGRITALLRIKLADGSVRRLASEPNWKTTLDAPEGWQAADFDDGAWKPVQPVGAPGGQVQWPAEPAMQMRTDFAVKKPVKQARLYATALGAYEARLNGRKVGDALLAPESADFRQHTLARAYDVTDMLSAGDNALGLMVGDGWYASTQIFAGRYSYGPAPRRVIAQLEIDYADGSREVIGTEPGWRIAASPIRSSEIYDGEVYDARLETPGWDTAGFNAASWEPSSSQATTVRIDAEVSPPIRATQTLRVKTVTSPKPGAYVFDFGQNFAGWCRLHVAGPAGTKVELRFAEILKPSGEVDQSNLRSARASDIYILKGDPKGEVFEPRFTYHGFRYVEVNGFPGAPTADALDGIVIHSDLPFTGRLKVDNPLIEQIWRNTVWSQRSNFMGVPTDCPQRDERMGWMGDAEVFWDAASFNMDVEAFTRRFMGEVRASQRGDGAFTDISPVPIPVLAGSPGWADAGIILPWTTYSRYGDTAVIDENWAAMERYLAWILAANPDHIRSHQRGADFGDWLSLDGKTPGDATTPKDLIGTAFWAYTSGMMVQMAEATGRTDGAAKYRALHQAIVTAFNGAFVKPDGQVGNDSQTSYILALKFGLLPEDARQAAAGRLAANIRARGTLLATGFLGTPFSLDVLADFGHADLAYSLLLRTEYPSWGYMVGKGATTMWERWNGDVGDVSMNSYNHYAFGAVGGFLFRRVAGIAPGAPGFKRIVVRPAIDPRVRSGGADYDSIMGRISTRWTQTGGGLSLDLTIPPNATAEVHLPMQTGGEVREGARGLAGRTDVRQLRQTGNEAVLEMGSGTYRFTVAG